MPILTIDTSATNQMLLRLQAIQASLMPNVLDALADIGTHVATGLSSAAPQGSDEGPPPSGDADGPLAESFQMELSGNETGAQVLVKTIQPTKLKFLRFGTGIYGPTGQPITAKHLTASGRPGALYWKGANHPVRSVKGIKPNDFVAPVLDEGKTYARERLSEAVGETLQGSE